jgi:steroid delta-isomerase-like uncharacterized protein
VITPGCMVKRLIACIPLLVACSPKPAADATASNKALASRAVDEMFNQRRPEAARAYVADDFRSHNPQVGTGPAGIEVFVRRFMDGFGVFRGETEMILAEGDRVMIWIRWTGKHTGTFAGVPATGQDVRFETIEIFRVHDGKFVEHWDLVDRLALQSALGLVQPARVGK